MKILQIISSLQTGGAEKLLTDFAPLLNKNGIQCDVAVLSDLPTPFVEKLKNEGVKVIALSRKMSIYNPLLIFKIIPFFNKYDLIHTHLFQPQYWTAMAKLLSYRKIPLLTTEHNTSNRRRNINFFKIFDRFVYRQYNKIIAISDATRNELIQYIGMSEKMTIIQNGIDVLFFKTAQAVERKSIDNSLKNSDFLLAMIAGFREQKDQDTVIRAMKLLPENVKLLLVGDGARREILQNLSISENVSNRVIFTGIRNDIAAVLKTVDIVVMSSHWEGFGLAAVEGMAAEKPVIASNVEGLADIVRDAGLLFEKGNEKQLAETILQLKNDKDFAADIAKKCARKSLEYDIQNMVENLILLYKKM